MGAARTRHLAVAVLCVGAVAGCSTRALRDLPEGAVRRLGDPSIRHPIGWETVMAVSRDGRLVATGAGRSPSDPRSGGAGILLWDSATARVSARLSADRTPLSLAFSPDGWRLASADASGVVEVWDLPLGRQPTTVARFAGPATAVHFSPDGERLLAADGRAGRVHLFEGDTLSPAAVLDAGARVFAARFLPGTRHLVVSTDAGVSVWSADGRRQRSLPGPRHEVLALATDPAGVWLAAVGFDGRLFVWRTRGWALERDLPLTPGHVVRSVAVAPDGARVAAGSVSQPNDVFLWSLQGEPLLTRLSGHEDSVHALCFGPDGNLLSADYRGVVWRWDPQGRPLSRGQAHSGRVELLAFTGGGRYLVSAGPWSRDRSRARLWDLEAGGSRALTSSTLLAVSPAGDRLATTDPEAGVLVAPLVAVDGRAGNGRGESALRIAATPDVRGGAFAHDGGRFAWIDNTSVHLVALPGGGPLRTWPYAGTPNAVAFSPDDRLLAAAGYDDRVRLFDPKTERPGPVLEGHTGPVLTLAFGAGADQLASGGEDGLVLLWDAAQGRVLRRLDTGARGVWALDWAAGGTRLAAAALDGAIHLWDPRTGREVATYRGHPGNVFALAFSPDSSRLASAGDDETILLWAVP